MAKKVPCKSTNELLSPWLCHFVRRIETFPGVGPRKKHPKEKCSKRRSPRHASEAESCLTKMCTGELTMLLSTSLAYLKKTGQILHSIDESVAEPAIEHRHQLAYPCGDLLGQADVHSRLHEVGQRDGGQGIESTAHGGEGPAEDASHEEPGDAGDVAKHLHHEERKQLVALVHLLVKQVRDNKKRHS